MIVALIIFLITYILMLSFQKYRPYIALTSAAVFVVLGLLNGQTGLFREGLTIGGALSAVDYNVLLMIAGTMGLVTLFVESKMPALLAETLISRVPNVKWAVTALALFAGVVSAFVDNVATVLMIAPIGLAISRRLKISPVPVLIAIAVSSNLQGAATMVGDTTSMLLGGAAGMNFLDFFWMNGRPGIFWGVELGALISAFALLFLFRKEEQAVSAVVETKVEDKVPTILLLGTIALLIVSSFIPTPQNEILLAIYNMAIYSLTLPIILNVIYIITNYFIDFTITYFQVAYITIAYIYLAAAIFIIKDDFIKKQQEVEKIKEEQKKVRDEIERQEQKNPEDKEEKNKEDKKKKDEKNDTNKNDGEPTGSEA